MKTALGIVFCFFWIFVFADNNQNSTRVGDIKVELSKSSTITVDSGDEMLSPEILVQYTISGFVYHQGSQQVPFPGVTVTCSNGVSVVTNNLGEWAILVDRLWSGTITPYYCGYYSFTPPIRTYSNVTTNKLGQTFTGEPSVNFTIQGTVTDSITSLPMAFFTVDFGNGNTTITNSSGQYSLQLIPCADYTLTPVSPGFTFFPLSRDYPNLTTNITDQNYTANPPPYVGPPGWEYISTPNVHTISVFTSANPNLCGVPLQAGDFIGAFYVGDDGLMHCGGFNVWNGTSNIAVILFGNDNTTPPKDGFNYGEVINWRVFISQSQLECYVAPPAYQTGGILTADNKYYSGSLSIITAMTAYKTHGIQLPAGWSGISSYILPRTGTAACTTLMTPILSKLVILQNLTQTYWPGQSVNTIGNWSATSGYKIKVTEAVTLPIIGCDYTPKTVSLAIGWNLTPVLSTCNAPIETLFAANLAKITVIKEIAGTNIYWPAVNIKTLLTLQPGKSYLIRATSAFSTTFPACTDLKDDEIVNPVFENNTPWNDPATTPSNHSIALPKEVLGKLMTGDVVGAFTSNGICAGIVGVDDLSKSVLLQVFGDDPTTLEKDGCFENEILSFRLYRPQLNEESEIAFEFDASMPSSDGHFITDGLSVAGKIVFNPTYINETGNSSISMYPNPGNGLVEFVAGDTERKFNVTIFDLTGQKACETYFTGKTQINLSTAPKGIYIVKIESNNFVKVEKLVIQ